MTFTAPTPSPDPEPETPARTEELVAGETVYLDMASVSLERMHEVTELVTHPHSAVHELRRRLSSAPAEPLSVVVTDRRVTIDEKTYALSHVASVSQEFEPKAAGCALVLMGLGAVAFLFLMCSAASLSSMGLGNAAWSSNCCTFFIALGLIGIGVLLYMNARAHHVVQLTATSGEVDGLRSVDEVPITQIHDAIYQALLQRGQ